ncbi:MAG: very short patch repair endonuclease [Proteobacteria bacterium]|nr:very short patch repair endonuclease [Pseudomonadota bacterium]
MTDTVDKQTRSNMMSAVRGKNTKLETEIRRNLFARGFRYRLHARHLPGKPDMVFPKYSAIIFVHGCFWHYHGCARSTIPENRMEWWQEKLQNNKIRDAKALIELCNDGWRVLVVWECSVRRPGLDREKALDSVCIRVGKFLRSERSFLEISGPLHKVKPERQVDCEETT